MTHPTNIPVAWASTRAQPLSPEKRWPKPLLHIDVCRIHKEEAFLSKRAKKRCDRPSPNLLGTTVFVTTTLATEQQTDYIRRPLANP